MGTVYMGCVVSRSSMACLHDSCLCMMATCHSTYLLVWRFVHPGSAEGFFFVTSWRSKVAHQSLVLCWLYDHHRLDNMRVAAAAAAVQGGYACTVMHRGLDDSYGKCLA